MFEDFLIVKVSKNKNL